MFTLLPGWTAQSPPASATRNKPASAGVRNGVERCRGEEEQQVRQAVDVRRQLLSPSSRQLQHDVQAAHTRHN